ncbi:MAG: toxin-antitoxin system HicB family antitoxin [Armatimonadetes bacterium]|nr:toxin-antitoxin system HicB family antitoxin [Armatimonadota bacterium]
MSTISLRLPESVHRRVRELAAAEEVSINQFITSAVIEKMAALLTVDYLRQRAARGDRAKFERALAVVPDVPPDEGDEYPSLQGSGG